MVLNPPRMDSVPSHWMGYKEQGSAYFQREEYEDALASYRAALSPEYMCPSSEKQIVWSNIVACRLKIGGLAQAKAAVEDAKTCISLNTQWSKGHVRLATAYIALGDHSNHACNSLQRALSLDSGNAIARQLLMIELRRGHANNAQQAQAASTSTHHPTPTAPTEAYDTPTGTGAAPREEPVYNDVTPDAPFHQANRGNVNMGVDESLSWKDRLSFFVVRASTWYNGQPDDVKTILKVLLGLVVLYIALGGQFGLKSVFGSEALHDNRGNYEVGNAYDRYNSYTSSDNTNNQRATRSAYGNSYANNHGRQEEYEYRPHGRESSNNYSSFHMPNLFDGSILSMICLAGIAFMCHRNGINPFQVLMMMNIVGGNRGRGRGMQHMGMAGMGYGMLRNAGGFWFGGQRGFRRRR